MYAHVGGSPSPGYIALIIMNSNFKGHVHLSVDTGYNHLAMIILGQRVRV